MHVHALIDVRDQEPSAETFEFVFAANIVHATDDDVTALERIGGKLPSGLMDRDAGLWIDGKDQPARDLNLGSAELNIGIGAADQAVQVRQRDVVVVDQHEVAETKMGQLLGNV